MPTARKHNVNAVARLSSLRLSQSAEKGDVNDMPFFMCLAKGDVGDDVKVSGRGGAKRKEPRAKRRDARR